MPSAAAGQWPKRECLLNPQMLSHPGSSTICSCRERTCMIYLLRHVIQIATCLFRPPHSAPCDGHTDLSQDAFVDFIEFQLLAHIF